MSNKLIDIIDLENEVDILSELYYKKPERIRQLTDIYVGDKGGKDVLQSNVSINVSLLHINS